MVDEIECPVVSGDLIEVADKRPVRSLQPAEEGTRRWVVVGLDALDLNLAIQPRDRMHAPSPVDDSTTETVANPVGLAPHLQPICPAAFEVLFRVRPAEAERTKHLHVRDLGAERGCHWTSWIRPPTRSTDSACQPAASHCRAKRDQRLRSAVTSRFCPSLSNHHGCGTLLRDAGAVALLDR
jgi:hypothetical protein